MENILRSEQPLAIGVGDATPPIYDTQLYHFEGVVEISDVFPKGIPLDVNSQKSAIYSYIKIR